MMQPVILPCNHGYCQECITHMIDMTCHICGRAFTVRDAKVNIFLQQICDWFGDNRTFISLLLGQDIPQPTPPPRLSRSASSDISRTRTFSLIASPLTRSNSTDSIGSMKDEEDKGTNGTTRGATDNGDSTRLDKFQIELHTKPEDANGNHHVSHKRFSINKVLSSSRGSPPDRSPKMTPSGLFKKMRAKKETDLPLNPLHKEEDAHNKSKSDAKQMKRESTSLSPLPTHETFGIMGMHKRTNSAASSERVVSMSEKITPNHKHKSKSFTPTSSPPNFLPSHLALRPNSATIMRKNQSSPTPPTPPSTPPSSPLIAHNPPTKPPPPTDTPPLSLRQGNVTTTRTHHPIPSTSPLVAHDPPTKSSATVTFTFDTPTGIPTPKTPSSTPPSTPKTPTTTPPTTPTTAKHPSPTMPIAIPSLPQRISTSEIASVAAAFLPGGAGTSLSSHLPSPHPLPAKEPSAIPLLPPPPPPTGTPIRTSQDASGSYSPSITSRTPHLPPPYPPPPIPHNSRIPSSPSSPPPITRTNRPNSTPVLRYSHSKSNLSSQSTPMAYATSSPPPPLPLHSYSTPTLLPLSPILSSLSSSAPTNVPPASRDLPDSSKSKNKSSKAKKHANLRTSGSLTNPDLETISDDDVSKPLLGTGINTVPNSSYARPVKLAPPSKPQGNIGRMFLDPLQRKLEFKENRRITPMPLSKRATVFFEAPSQTPIPSDSEALQSIAMYLPTEVLEMGVILATKDTKCVARPKCRKHARIPPPKLDKWSMLSASAGVFPPMSKPRYSKRRSLPNILDISAFAEHTVWKSSTKTHTPKGFSTELFNDSAAPRTGSLSLGNGPPLPPFPSTPPPSPPLSSYSPTFPRPSHHTLPTIVEPPSSHPHKKIGLFMSKFKSFSISSDDLKRDAEEVLKWQGRAQTMADVNNLIKYLGKELSKDLLQYVTKMENYRRYRWTTGDLSEYKNPPLVHKTGWNVEYKGQVPWGRLNFDVEDKHKDVHWYHDNFYKKPHATYLAGDSQNPLFIAVATDGSAPYKLLVRSVTSDERLCVLDYSRKYISKVLDLDFESTRHVKEASIQQLCKDMANWDLAEVSNKFKFGVLYCKGGQTTEEQIFSNTGTGSAEYEKFLSCIGDKVQMRGWQSFHGGLSTTEDCDGVQSIYTRFRQFEIMFHVSTLLSHEPTDKQYLAKKKHIGNDIVVVVFMDIDAPPLDPAFMRTHFTQVYILVQPFYPESGASGSTSPCFRISAVAKDGVRPFGPAIPDNVDFSIDHMLKSFLLLKLINAERAALASSVFCDKLANARRQFLSGLLNTCK
eukprot:Phypoly_transcript_00328.p1 GENE.Phypoly_transcript_00328~~Phypoly_transcript_00328.p1  ORF type:complete len:1301 (-),score=247.36 Phypoly_transcript_00328:874-4776(-)